ncbi:MAG: DUF3408 domain-containing protein [Bacteroidales bacterium]|jgi:hypothetical protein|nr:DUF3408 domain-containing protein [Bacteroidales bacterium]
MAKRINTDEIDESFIIASVRKDRTGVPESVQQPPVSVQQQVERVMPVRDTVSVSPEPSGEETRNKREKRQEYESLFIRESNVTARLGKTVYIRKEFHDRILKIVQVIGANEISLFSYMDNLIAHHFETFQDEISQSYRRKNRDIF